MTGEARLDIYPALVYHRTITLTKETATMNWDEFFKAMIAEEHAAYAKYAAAAAQASEPKLKELLDQFRYEESVHADLLQREYDRWRARAK
jgi:rubrerythrin